MEFVRVEKFICTSCGMMTTQKPDDDGHVECKICFSGMTEDEYEKFCKEMEVSSER